MRIPKKIILISSIFLSLCLLTPVSRAEKGYVTESFKISLRKGPGYDHDIIVSLSSGTPVAVVTSKGDWVRVRFQMPGGKNKEGWILKRYLMDHKPLKEQVRLSKKENVGLKNDLIRIEKDLQKSIRRNRKLEKDVKEKTASLDRLEKNYRDLRKGVYSYPRLKVTHKIMRSRIGRNEKDIRGLLEENNKMRNSQITRWLITGALVLLCGLLIGLVFGRQHRKRPYY
ncbi:MAG: TIGR04211 family SH3 domain-containing protein [Deltaproteobacteria bacterium]|nr:TIGR04211 family SH3 domain-containing protein [Deltaproteobacteria bacterium]